MGRDLLVSRRGLLQAGLIGSAAVWCGGALGCARSARAPRAAARAALSPAGEEILAAVIPVVLGPLLPAGPARERALDAGLASVDDYLASLSLPLQREASDAFDTLDLPPVRALLLGTWQPWRDAPAGAVEAFLRSARQSRFLLARRIYALLQSLAVVAWFDQPEAWREIGYPGPPIGPHAPGAA